MPEAATAVPLPHIDDPKHFAQGLLEQAMHHADLAEADHKTFVEAVAKGDS